MASLDNIEVFLDDTGFFHIVGYGDDTTAASLYNNYRAFEAVGKPTSSMSYRTMHINNTEFGSMIDDMTVTDNFVVFIGKSINPYISVQGSLGLGYTFYTFPKIDMFGNPPFHSQFFQTSTFVISAGGNEIEPTSNEPTYQSRPRIVHYKSDAVAVCSHRDNLVRAIFSTPNSFQFIPTQSFLVNRTFDLSPLLSGNNITMHWVSMACAPIIKNTDIDGFLYDASTQRYVVLHHYDFASNP